MPIDNADAEVYALIKAAKYLGVPPWELRQQPSWWRDVALCVQAAEIKAERMVAERRAKSKQKTA